MAKDWDWVGSWEGPGCGEYVIREDGRELEPHEVVDYIRRLHDLLEQLESCVRSRSYMVNDELCRSKEMPIRSFPLLPVRTVSRSSCYWHGGEQQLKKKDRRRFGLRPSTGLMLWIDGVQRIMEVTGEEV